MPYIANDYAHRSMRSAVGSGQCVALVQEWAGAPTTSSWRQGTRVKGNGALISRGTAIATFVNGVYPNHAHGNHAAIFIDEVPGVGIKVIDQWSGQVPHERTIRYGGHGGSNDGDGFFVIE